MNAFKKILKKLLPTPFLKEAFLVYNKVKLNTIDRVLFSELKLGTEEFLIYRKGYPFRENAVDILDLQDAAVKTFMQEWNEWTQEEFLVLFNKPCWIEPEFGWGIVEPFQLIYYSIGVSRTVFQKKPSLTGFWFRKNVQHVACGLSLRDSGEENYFHFYNDVLTKIFFLQQQRIALQNLSLIISKKLWDKEYFQFYYRNSEFLQSLNWLVQDRQYIQTDSIYFVKPLTHRVDLWALVLSPFVISRKSSGTAKIFLTRSKSRLRFIENESEIATICGKFKFEMLDTDHLSIAQQIEIFSGVNYLVGIHGAGLTNMAFCKGSCSILELFPPPDLGYLPYHYIMLAKMLHFEYSAIIGEPGKIKFSGGFHLSPERFERALVKFLDPQRIA